MGKTISMGAQYKDHEGNWHTCTLDHTMCMVINDEECRCKTALYCPYFKAYAFFKVLDKIPRTYERVGYDYAWAGTTTYFTTLQDIKDFDWDQEIEIDKYICEEGIIKCSEVSKYFLTFSLPELEKLSQKHGGDDNIRIRYEYKC